MHTTEQNHIRIGVARCLGELETVADVVGDVLDIGVLVVVRQNDGVALPAKGVDFVEDVEDGLGHGGPP